MTKITTAETAPTFEPLSIDEVKAWCRVDGFEDDLSLARLIKSAVKQVENRLSHRLADRTVEFGYHGFSDLMRLPLSPVRAVTSVTYLDLAGDRKTLDADAYNGAFATLAPVLSRAPGTSWPSHLCQPGSVIVTASVGYVDTASVPDDLIQAACVIVSDLFKNREGATQSEAAVDRLLSTYRNGWFG